MKIIANQRNLKGLVYKNVYYSITCTQEHVVLEGTRYTAVVEGVIYRIQNRLCRHMRKDDIIKELTVLLSKPKDTITSHLEGIYVIAVNDNENNILYIFRSDTVSYDLYYKPGTQKYIVSSDIKDLSENSLLDNNGVACILTEGYCPDRHTQYKGVYRLATDEYLLIKKDKLEKFKKHPSPLKIDEDLKLERYYNTLKTAILSRASNTINWVETSGGWDSATILGTLRTYDCKDIRAITVSVSLSDGLNFNKYEVSKSQELAKYYNVPLTIVDFNLNDDSLLHTFRSNLEVIKNQHIFDTQSLWKPVMYDVVNAEGEEGNVCFNGLFSDSIHNFGFSQYLTLIDNSTVFREFADKMATYLYSPSFFRKILDSSYSKDFIYRMFQWHNMVKDTDIYEVHSQMDKMNKYLLSFIYGRYRTVPISKPIVYDYMTESGRQKFEYFLNIAAC